MKKTIILFCIIFSGFTLNAQITKVEVEKPTKEIRIPSMQTYVEFYKEYVKVKSWDFSYRNLKPRFSFSLSKEDYESLYELTQNKDLEEGDTFTLTDFKTGDLIILMMKDKILYLAINNNILPPGIFIGRWGKKFFNKQ